MRPYLVLSAVILIAVAAFGQQPVPRPYGGYYGAGYGPYVPLISTPMLSLETVSPNPVGASNATTGLVAGATNSTLSMMEDSTSSEYTVPVWYQGGAPLTTSDVHIWPEPIGREHHAMHGEMGGMMRGMMGEEREHARQEARSWMYFTGAEHTASVAGAAKGSVKAGRAYGNDDVTRQNDNNGTVKYDGKTEKIK